VASITGGEGNSGLSGVSVTVTVCGSLMDVCVMLSVSFLMTTCSEAGLESVGETAGSVSVGEGDGLIIGGEDANRVSSGVVGAGGVSTAGGSAAACEGGGGMISEEAGGGSGTSTDADNIERCTISLLGGGR